MIKLLWRNKKNNYLCNIFNLSIWTAKPEQRVQTQIIAENGISSGSTFTLNTTGSQKKPQHLKLKIDPV